MIRLIEPERPKSSLVFALSCLATEGSNPSNSTALPYSWRQELGEVDIVVPVPKGTRGKNIDVIIQKNRLSVGLKGQDKILDGELCKEIKVEESAWTLGEYP